jgi:transcriptional regulator with XRE-family HTH domain
VSKSKDISKLVSKLRDVMGLNQELFAQQLGVSRNYVSMLENGREPSQALLNLIERLEKEHLFASKVEAQAAEYGGARRLLKELREKKKLTQGQLAAAVGYSLGVYQEIEDGRSSISRKMAERLARELGCTVDDLTNGGDHPTSNGTHFGTFGETPPVDVPPGMKVKYVPLLSMAQCGSMGAYDDSAYTHDGFIAFNSEDPKAFAVKLAGESMTPVFSPGDVAVIYPSKAPKNGAVVIARLNDEHGADVMMKLYQASGNNVTLSSYNPAFPPMTFPRQYFTWIYPVASVTKVLH